MTTGMIYGFLDSNGVVFYIGQTINHKNRIREHRNEVRKGNKLYSYNKLRKVMRETGKSVKDLFVVLEDKIGLDKLDDKEIEYIKRYRNHGIKLANLTDGGKGALTFPDYVRKMVSEKRKGFKHSEETKKLISESRKGMVFSEEHKSKLKAARAKRTITQETRQKASNTSTGKINIKKYILTSPEGVEYTTENGLSDFCRKHGLIVTLMSKVAQGKRKHHKGWKAKRNE